jgi:zinc transport system permease protein
MTLPVAAAMQLAKGFKQMMVLSILFGEVSVIIGIILGYYLSIPPGGTIVMIAVSILLIAIGYKRSRKSTNEMREA